MATKPNKEECRRVLSGASERSITTSINWEIKLRCSWQFFSVIARIAARGSGRASTGFTTSKSCRTESRWRSTIVVLVSRCTSSFLPTSNEVRLIFPFSAATNGARFVSITLQLSKVRVALPPDRCGQAINRCYVS